jgi:hypothetical protein
MECIALVSRALLFYLDEVSVQHFLRLKPCTVAGSYLSTWQLTSDGCANGDMHVSRS